jgi:hypothetical protein
VHETVFAFFWTPIGLRRARFFFFFFSVNSSRLVVDILALQKTWLSFSINGVIHVAVRRTESAELPRVNKVTSNKPMTAHPGALLGSITSIVEYIKCYAN